MHANYSDQVKAHSRHLIPVRKMGFDFNVEIPKHYINGKAYETHFFNGLQLLFPEGERFFMKAVRDSLDKVTDENLIKQAKGFFGQETQHAIEHDALNQVLEKQGYRLTKLLERFNSGIQRSKRIYPKAWRLASTAGGEHITAVLGVAALNDTDVDNATPVVRNLIKWHAMEEIEHKAVAFDVLQQAYPNYLLRVLGFCLSYLFITTAGRFLTGQLLLQDGYSKKEIRQMRKSFKADWKRKHPDYNRQMLAYFKPNFHPFENDDSAALSSAKLSLGLS